MLNTHFSKRTRRTEAEEWANSTIIISTQSPILSTYLVNFYHPDKETKPGLSTGQKSFNSSYAKTILKSFSFRKVCIEYHAKFKEDCKKERNKKTSTFIRSMFTIVDQDKQDGLTDKLKRHKKGHRKISMTSRSRHWSLNSKMQRRLRKGFWRHTKRIHKKTKKSNWLSSTTKHSKKRKRRFMFLIWESQKWLRTDWTWGLVWAWWRFDSKLVSHLLNWFALSL